MPSWAWCFTEWQLACDFLQWNGYVATSGPLLGIAVPPATWKEIAARMSVGSRRSLILILGIMAPQLLHGLVLPGSPLIYCWFFAAAPLSQLHAFTQAILLLGMSHSALNPTHASRLTLSTSAFQYPKQFRAPRPHPVYLFRQHSIVVKTMDCMTSN